MTDALPDAGPPASAGDATGAATAGADPAGAASADPGAADSADPGAADPARPGRDPFAFLVAGAPLLAGLVAFGLARSILLPDHGFWDTAEFQAVAPLFGTAHPTGYPTYVTLGWLASLALAPFGEPAFRLNLLSAALLGVASGLLVVLVRGLTGRTSVALAAGILLALTPIPWRMGGFADPHTLHLALTAGLLVVLTAWERRAVAGVAGADRWLLGAAVLYGVMLGNHSLTVLLAPGIALFVLAVEPGILRRRRFVARCTVALLGTAALLYLQLPIRAAMGAPLVYGHPDTLGGFLYIVLGRQFGGDVVDPFGDLAGKVTGLVEIAIDQLGLLAALLPAAFVVVAVRRPRFALLTGTWLVVTCWFAAVYTNAAIDRYYLGPVLVAIAWLAVAAGILAGAPDASPEPADGPGTVAEPAHRLDEALQPAGDPAAEAGRDAGGRSRLLSGLLAVGLSIALLVPAVRAAPTTARLVDQSHDTRAPQWTRWVLATVEDDAVLVTWWSLSTPLWYRTLVLGERPDVRVVDDRDRLDENLGSVDDVIRANLPERPVYIMRLPADVADVEERWVLEEIRDPADLQPIYRVVGPREAEGAGAAGRGAGASRPRRPVSRSADG